MTRQDIRITRRNGRSRLDRLTATFMRHLLAHRTRTKVLRLLSSLLRVRLLRWRLWKDRSDTTLSPLISAVIRPLLKARVRSLTSSTGITLSLHLVPRVTVRWPFMLLSRLTSRSLFLKFLIFGGRVRKEFRRSILTKKTEQTIRKMEQTTRRSKTKPTSSKTHSRNACPYVPYGAPL